MAKRTFSLYDIEQYLREAGAEKINEKAVLSFEEELSDTVKDIVGEAQVYANHAGRSKLIKSEDLELVGFGSPKLRKVIVRAPPKKRKLVKRAKMTGPPRAVINVRPAQPRL